MTGKFWLTFIVVLVAAILVVSSQLIIRNASTSATTDDSLLRSTIPKTKNDSNPAIEANATTERIMILTDNPLTEEIRFKTGIAPTKKISRVTHGPIFETVPPTTELPFAKTNPPKTIHASDDNGPLIRAVTTPSPPTILRITIPPTTVAPATIPLATTIPTTIAPRTIAPRTIAPATIATATIASATIRPTTGASSISPTSNTTQCMTPVGKTGECIDLYECAPLFNMLQNKPLLEENKLYLRRSQCGHKNRRIMVCCPEQQNEIAQSAPAFPGAFPSTTYRPSLLPQPGQCGAMITNQLYGGHTTEIDSFRWSALLQYSTGNNTLAHYCGGTLINDRYILTAAHCVVDIPKTRTLKSVRLGEWDTSTDRDCDLYADYGDCSDSHIDVPIEKVIPHKDYKPGSQNKNKLHDIALIRLSKSVPTTNFIQPVCLPGEDNFLHAFDTQSLELVGWGTTTQGRSETRKMKSHAAVVPLHDCSDIYAEVNVKLEPTQFCVGGQFMNETCYIDSGGAAISFDTGNMGLGSFYLAGVSSFGPSTCTQDRWPTVFTRVGEYINWIVDNIKP